MLIPVYSNNMKLEGVDFFPCAPKPYARCWKAACPQRSIRVARLNGTIERPKDWPEASGFTHRSTTNIDLYSRIVNFTRMAVLSKLSAKRAALSSSRQKTLLVSSPLACPTKKPTKASSMAHCVPSSLQPVMVACWLAIYSTQHHLPTCRIRMVRLLKRTYRCAITLFPLFYILIAPLYPDVSL